MLTVKLIFERLDKNGRLLERKEHQFRSFLIAFMQFLQSMHDQINVNINDITNVARAQSFAVYNGMSIASPGGWGPVKGSEDRSDYSIEGEKIGIVVGTGVVAPTPTDYALGTRIVHGKGAGELEYGGTELLPIVVSAPNAEFTIRRYFTNHSGGPITVNEVGIYALIATATIAYAACIARDVVVPGVAVADGQILRVTYVPQITV